MLRVSVPENKAGSGGRFIKVSEFKDTTQLFLETLGKPIMEYWVIHLQHPFKGVYGAL